MSYLRKELEELYNADVKNGNIPQPEEYSNTCTCGKPAVNVGYCSAECYELDNFDGDSQHLE